MTDNVIVEVVGEFAAQNATQWATHHSVGAAIALVASNAPLLLAVAYCIVYGLLPEAAVTTATFLASSAYHLCQTTDVCVFSLYTHVISDHIFVFTLIVWMFLFLLRIRLDVHAALFVLGLLFVVPVMIQYMNAWWVTPVVALVLIVAYVATWAVRGRWPAYDWLDMGIGVALMVAGCGFFFAAGPPDGANYVWAHSIWHALVMLGLYFALEMTDGEPLTAKLRRRLGHYHHNHHHHIDKQHPNRHHAIYGNAGGAHWVGRPAARRRVVLVGDLMV